MTSTDLRTAVYVKRQRNGHNEGTVYERKRTRPDGSKESLGFASQISLPNGKRRTFYGKNRKEVRAKLREAQLLLEQGKLSLGNGNVTVGQHLMEWLDSVAKPNLTYHTYEAYEISVRKRLIPSLGPIPLSKLKAHRIQELYADLGKTLKPKSIRQTHVALNQALQLAVEWDRIALNPASKVKLPKIRQVEKTILSPEQVAQLLSATRGHRLFALWQLLVNTGLRKGEVLGLKWSDLDWNEGSLKVQRQVIRKTSIGLVLEDLKTRESRRTLVLGEDTLASLREHKQRQDEEKFAGEWWETRPEYKDLIFTTKQGKSLDPATIWATFQRVLKDAHLPRMTLHALRDTAATNMLRGGTDSKTISERLGHSDVALTLRVYGHVTHDMHREAAARLEAVYRNGTTKR